MKIFFYALLIASAVITPKTTTAQTTFYKDLSDRSHLPLYDCSIYSQRGDQRLCERLKGHSPYRFENGGYAISCYTLSPHDTYSCLRLAESLQYQTEMRLNCHSGYRSDISRRQCEITKLAYFEGRFQDRRERVRSNTTTTRTVVREEPVYTSTTTCDYRAYDRAVDRWRIKKEEQRKKGQTRAAVGVVATIGGIILGNSNDRTVRTIGQGLTIGGVFMTTWGLVDVIDADISFPHMDPYCRTNWVMESRRVVIEEQQCTTTRCSDRNYYSSRYYYEVNCSNKRYVTFEEFRPWDEGRPLRY